MFFFIALKKKKSLNAKGAFAIKQEEHGLPKKEEHDDLNIL